MSNHCVVCRPENVCEWYFEGSFIVILNNFSSSKEKRLNDWVKTIKHLNGINYIETLLRTIFIKEVLFNVIPITIILYD